MVANHPIHLMIERGSYLHCGPTIRLLLARRRNTVGTPCNLEVFDATITGLIFERNSGLSVHSSSGSAHQSTCRILGAAFKFGAEAFF